MHESSINLDAKPIISVENARLINEMKIQTECSSQEDVVNNACKTILLNAGIRKPGQTIRINKGRYTGFQGIIETINWTDAEVRCEKNARWFSIWHDRDFFTVLDPSTDAPPPAAALATSPYEPPDPSLAVPKIDPVTSPIRISEPALPWLPKRIS